MNQENNEKKGKINIGAVIILVISALVFIPVGGYGIISAFFDKANEKDKPVFGTYDGKNISWEMGADFTKFIDNYASYYQMMGIDTNDAQIRQYIFQSAYQQSIEKLAYTKKVTSSGYKVSEKAIDRQLVNYYRNADGSFDERSYKQATANEVNEQRKAIREDLTVQRYLDDLIGEATKFKGESLYGPKTSSKELAFIASMGTEKHSFDMATFSTAEFPVEEVVKWASSNKDKFTKYDMSVITVEDENEAKSILKQLNANEITFQDAVETRSSQIYSDAAGKLQSAYAYNLKNEVIANEEDVAAVTALAKGAISDVIATKNGTSSSYSIFRCDGASVAANLDDEEMVSVVQSYLKSYESGYIENYYINIAKTFITETKVSSFDEACAKFEIEKAEVPAFPVNYGNSSFMDSTSSVAPLNSTYRNVAVLKSLFGLKLNEISEPTVIGSNVVVVKCTGIQVDEPADSSSFSTTMASNDQLSAQQHLMADEKLKDNFWSAYYQYVGY